MSYLSFYVLRLYVCLCVTNALVKEHLKVRYTIWTKVVFVHITIGTLTLQFRTSSINFGQCYGSSFMRTKLINALQNEWKKFSPKFKISVKRRIAKHFGAAKEGAKSILN